MEFRKKPVVVEAIQFTGENIREILNFIKEQGGCWQDGKIIIFTLEGNMIATQMDWIIKGVNGENYPCKPDIFEKTYEPVKENQPQSVEGWEERFVRLAYPVVHSNTSPEKDGEYLDSLKQFIHQLLAHQQSELLETVKAIVERASAHNCEGMLGQCPYCLKIESIINAVNSLSNNKS